MQCFMEYIDVFIRINVSKFSIFLFLLWQFRTDIMVSVWSITDIEYIIVEDTNKMHILDLDGYR